MARPYGKILGKEDVALVLLLLGMLLLTQLAKTAEPHPDPVVTDSRTCAALAVYALATDDDWGQRAAIAQATLNSHQSSGVDPDCGKNLVAALTGPFDSILWRNSLDAVYAVSSGSYDVPLACQRVTTVAPLDLSTPPPQGAVTRSQCVVNGLAFEGGAQ